MDNPIFGVPRSFRFAAGPAHFADGDGDGDGGDGSSGDQGSSGDGDSNDVASHLDPNRLIQEHGDAQRALGALSQKAETLESENAEYREQIRNLKEKTPGDGDVVISDDHMERLREQGFIDSEDPTAEDVITALEQEHQQRTDLENKMTFQEVINVTGADRGVLEDLGADTLNYEIREVETEGDDGETQTRKEVVIHTEDGTESFTDYMKDNYPNLSDTILDGVDESGGDSGDSGDDEESASTYVPSQPTGSSDDSGSTGAVPDTDEFLEQENERRGRA